MASILAHELSETATDPQLNAWYDSTGAENDDKCAWTFGTTYSVGNGSIANMKLGTRDFLIQQNWVNKGGGYCGQGYALCTDASCNDNNPCTVDVCDPSVGCSHTAVVDTTPCNDGLCSTGRTCTTGVCGAGTPTDCSGSA